MSIHYQALFESAPEGGFVVTFPDLGHGATQGETEAEAMEMAADFLACVVSDYLFEGTALPEARMRRGKRYRMVSLPALPAAKIELHKAFVASGIRKTELAGRLGIPKSNVDRLFDVNHSSRLEHLDAAFAALGKQLVIQVAEAA